MKKFFSILFCATVLSVSAFAHRPFTLISTEKKTIKFDDLVKIEKERTMGKKEKTTLTFTEKEIRLVILTGPADDMLSYRIQGMLNPTLVVPAEARLRILFVNSDEDMLHDIRFGDIVGDFPIAPDIVLAVGSTRLAHRSADETMQAEEFVLQATEPGVYKYFCSVVGHAKGGMWGNIAVGVKPGDIKRPEPSKHDHSPDEDKMDTMPGMKKDDKQPEKKPADMAGMPGMNHGDHQMKMMSVTNIGDPMERESSGTSWQPDSSPVYAKMLRMSDDNDFMLMLMGTAFVRYTNIGSKRNVSASGKGSRGRVDAPSMFMLMESLAINDKAQVGFHVMASLDPIIQRGYGYPLLYQSGEQFRGQPIHDRQHPHDLFSELAVTYSYKFDDKRSFYLYAGYPGEPALGPPMYLHRTSGMNNPDAPIGHHWQDATHITFGVVTAGFSFGRAKLEASAFNGTEPNENRYNFDKPRLNSFSGRFSFNPTRNISLQISHGYLRDPEPLEPGIRILRKTTASAIYNKMFDENHNWANTFVFGQNHANGENTNSVLFESNYDFFRNAVFGRVETVQKTGHDLVLDPAEQDKIFRVESFSIGYIRDLIRNKGIDVGLGAMATINSNSAALSSYYGGKTHGGWQFFLRFRPSRSGH